MTDLERLILMSQIGVGDSGEESVQGLHKQIHPSHRVLRDGHQENSEGPLATRTEAGLFEMEIGLLSFVRAFDAGAPLVSLLPGL